MQPGSPFLLGVNYWPRKKAMFMWQHFDAGEIREEFAIIRALGLTHVRLFLLWESFQPDPKTVSQKALADLRTVADIAGELGLKLEPTFFTGHMSGPNWAPDWLLSKTPRSPGDLRIVSLNRHTPSPTAIHNVFTTPFVLEAAKLQLQTVCSALKDHPAIWAWSLGNEPDLFCHPPDDATGRQWIRTMAGIIKAADPNHLVTIGFHTMSLDGNVHLRPDHAAEATDFSVMHGYPIYNPIARAPLDPDFVPFTASLTAALAGRPVLYEEFGICTHIPDRASSYETMTLSFNKPHRQFFASEKEAGDYYAAVLPRLQKVGCLGAFAWCFADYDPALWDKPPCDVVIHERTFGLVRADGSLKPSALAIKAFAATCPAIQPLAHPVALPGTADDYYKNPSQNMAALYAKFPKL